MAEVPDHLVPQDGLTDADIRFTKFEAAGSGAVCYFTMRDEDGEFVGQFPIEVHPSRAAGASGSIDGLVATAHQEMANVLRQWLFWIDRVGQEYGKRPAQRDPE